MEMTCSMCNSILSSSNLKFSCSHFLCNKCLSRKLLLSNFSPLTNTKCVEMKCTCGGTISVPYNVCLKNILNAEKQKKKNKFCIKHKEKTDTYCPTCRTWLCEECISTFHNDVYKNHKLATDDKVVTSKCFYHRENYNDLFCVTCNKLICHECVTDSSNPENLHKNHSTYTLEDYHKLIKDKKKYLKFKNYDECMRFIDTRENEITKDFSDKCNESKEYIEDIIKKMEELRDNYITKYDQELTNLKNIFSIVRESYKNYYKELDGEKIDLKSFEFIQNIKEQINNITYTPLNFNYIEDIYDSINNIKTSKYYNIKFNFKKLVYEKSQSIDTEEGITTIFPLKSIPKSFACGTTNGKIQIYSKEDDYEYALVSESGNQDKGSSINALIELKKTDKCLISGSSDKTIRIYNIEKKGEGNKSSYKLSCKKELYNNGIILSLIELSDGRIASSTSDNKIKIWYTNCKSFEDDNVVKIENSVKNQIKVVGYELCLAEASTLENDENNKQLISGSSNGDLKFWDTFSGKLGKSLKFNNSCVTCLININNHKLAVGYGDGVINIIDLFEISNYKVLSGHKSGINSICYLKWKLKLFSCSKDSTIKIWDLETMQCTNTLYKQHTSLIYGLIICGNDLISCGNDKTINIYSTGEGENDEYNDFEKDNDNDEEENYDKFV